MAVMRFQKKHAGKAGAFRFYVSILVFLLITPMLLGGCGKVTQQTRPDSFLLSKGDLEKTVVLTGKIAGGAEIVIAGQSDCKITKVNYLRGERVVAGAALAECDTSALELQIRASQLELEKNKKSAQFTYDECQTRYEKALADFESGKNEQIRQAQAEVDKAYRDLVQAKNNENSNPEDDLTIKSMREELVTLASSLEKAKKDLENAEHSVASAEYVAALTRFDSARNAWLGLSDEIIQEFASADAELEDAKKAYSKNSDAGNEKRLINAALEMDKVIAKFPDESKLWDEYRASEAALETLKDKENADLEELREAVYSAQRAYDLANDKLQAELQNLESSQKAGVEAAAYNYEQAVLALESAKQTALKEIDSLKSELKRYELNLDFKAEELDIARQKKMLEDANLVAPISGIVVECNAEVGNTASGKLFVIQDSSNFYASCRVSEYDVENIAIGQKVRITSNVSDEREFQAEVVFISPVALETSVENASEFEVLIRINDSDDALKLGASARAQVIVDKRQSVYFVPIEAVEQLGNGRGLICVIDEEGSITQVEVQTGLETDYSIEIASDDLRDGMLVLKAFPEDDGTGVNE